MLSFPILILSILTHTCLKSQRPTTDKLYIWTEQLESSARRLKLRYVADHNIESKRRTITVEEVASRAAAEDAYSDDPTAEPLLPLGRYDEPQYSDKKLTSLGLELWIKRMHARSDSFSVDKKGPVLFKESIKELRQIGLTIIDAQETSMGSSYIGGIDASGYDPSPKERIIVRLRIYSTTKSTISVVELTVYSRDKEQVITLSEQLKQVLWQ